MIGPVAPSFGVGDRIKFPETGNRWWTVRVATNRFSIATQQVPFEKRGTLRYTIIDHAAGIRGACNLIGWGYGTGSYSDDECAQVLDELEAGTLEVSHRNRVRAVPLAIEGRPPGSGDAHD